MEVLLHFFKHMRLSLGMGDLSPEAAQTLTQKDCWWGRYSQVTAWWAAFCSGHEKNVHFCAPGLGIMYI